MKYCNQSYSSTETESVTRTFDWDQRDSVQTAVITTVAAVTNQDPTKMAPLSHVIDTDALDSIFAPTCSTPRATGTIKFEYEGCTVTISADGTVSVRPRPK